MKKEVRILCIGDMSRVQLRCLDVGREDTMNEDVCARGQGVTVLLI